MPQHSASLIRLLRSRCLPGYTGNWIPLATGLVDGELTTVGSAWLHANRSAAWTIARESFAHLFGAGHYFVEGLGGNRAASVMANVLLQIATDDPRCLTVVSAARSTLQSMERLVHKPVSVVPSLTWRKATTRPVIPLSYDSAAVERLELPTIVTADRVGEIRLGHFDRRAPMRLLRFDDVARDASGVELYRSEKLQFTRVTPDDLRLLEDGKPAQGRHTSYRKFGDQWIQALDMPTLMIYELRPCGSRYTNFRFGMSFSLGGETVLTLGTKSGDLERYLEFFDPDWEAAIRSQLAAN